MNRVMKPYYVPLSEEQKDHLTPIADEGIPFGDKVDGYLESKPKYNAQYIDIAETHKDYRNFKKALPTIGKIQGMQKEFVDIRIASSSDANMQFLAYYGNVKNASRRGVPGAKAVYEELSKRWKGRNRKPIVPKS